MNGTRAIRTATAAIILASVAWVVLWTNAKPAAGADSIELDHLVLCAPDTNTFSLAGNDFFPLPVRRHWILTGREQGQNIGFRVTVLNARERLYRGTWNISTRVVEEKEWADEDGDGSMDAGEPLLEISRNYFARTTGGTVCYFGEAVDIYEDGIVVGHEGSWRADEQGHAPGIFMPANPQVGMTYQQEVAPGIAEDRATIIDAGRTVRVPAGTFEDTIHVRDFNPLDGSKGVKAYARGVGIIVDGPLELRDVIG